MRAGRGCTPFPFVSLAQKLRVRRKRFASLLLLPALLPALAAVAETAYPSRPIRLIIPYPAGGPRDIQARLISNRLTELWGRTVIIDNRAGASGLVGTDL